MPDKQKPRWTNEQDDVLRQGYEQGLLAIEIAAQLGRTKNQILGRAFRLGLKSKLVGIGGNARYNQLFGAPHPTDQPTHFAAVLEWGQNHPFGTPKECSEQTGIGYKTVCRHVRAIKQKAGSNA